MKPASGGGLYYYSAAEPCSRGALWPIFALVRMILDTLCTGGQAAGL
jgi:hypothetical protein